LPAIPTGCGGVCAISSIAEISKYDNESYRKNNITVFGVVTTGILWRFLRLEGTTVEIDTEERTIESPEEIIGILVGVIREAHHSHTANMTENTNA
jgi:hypothetical protein